METPQGFERDVVVRAEAVAGSLGGGVFRGEVLPGGNENHAVRVTSRIDDLVVRFARDSARTDDPFDAEAWCLVAAAEAGVRTSVLIGRGSLEGVSYLVTRYIPGETAAHEDLSGWHAIGEFTRSLRRISTIGAPGEMFSRFGRDLDHAWQEHLRYNVASLIAGDPLIPLDVYPASRRGELRDTVESLAARRLPQGLVHGDASHRNLLRSGDGDYTVIDWGAVSTGPSMWGDLARIYRWHILSDRESPVSAVAWESVLDGAGLDRVAAEPVVRELAALHALDIVRWAISHRPERLEEIIASSRSVLHEVLRGMGRD